MASARLRHVTKERKMAQGKNPRAIFFMSPVDTGAKIWQRYIYGQKNFGGWHDLKSKMEEQHRMPYFHEREIWWCSIGLNLGREEDGKNELFHRPVVILKKFSGELFWALPITSKSKSGVFYASVVVQFKEQTALLSQLRTLSSKRLLRRIGKMGGLEYEQLIQAIRRLL